MGAFHVFICDLQIKLSWAELSYPDKIAVQGLCKNRCTSMVSAGNYVMAPE